MPRSMIRAVNLSERIGGRMCIIYTCSEVKQFKLDKQNGYTKDISIFRNMRKLAHHWKSIDQQLKEPERDALFC